MNYWLALEQAVLQSDEEIYHDDNNNNFRDGCSFTAMDQ